MTVWMTTQKFEDIYIYIFFRKLFCAPRLHLFDQILISAIFWTIITILKCFLFEYILKCNLFLWRKAEFSASLLFSVTWSSEIILTFAAQETFLIIINVEAVVPLHIFVKTIIFSGLLMNRKFKRTAIIWLIFYNIINVLLSLSINWMHPCWIKVFISLKKLKLSNVF